MISSPTRLLQMQNFQLHVLVERRINSAVTPLRLRHISVKQESRCQKFSSTLSSSSSILNFWITFGPSWNHLGHSMNLVPPSFQCIPWRILHCVWLHCALETSATEEGDDEWPRQRKHGSSGSKEGHCSATLRPQAEPCSTAGFVPGVSLASPKHMQTARHRRATGDVECLPAAARCFSRALLESEEMTCVSLRFNMLTPPQRT